MNNKFIMPAASVIVFAEIEKLTYTITINSSTNGTITANKTFAVIDDEILVDSTANIGYKLSRIYYVLDGQTQQTDIANGKFNMPGSSVLIFAEFVKIDFLVSKAETENGSFEINRPIANYEDEILISINPDSGWQMKDIYYLLDGSNGKVNIENNKFNMPAGNVVIHVEFEKIAYSIIIPKEVVVTRQEKRLTNESSVYVGDVLIFTFDSVEHCDVQISVNGTFKNSGENFIVGADNVEIVYIKTQNEWQVNFADGENYLLVLKIDGAPISSGIWVRKDVLIEIVLTPTDKYEITDILVNGMSVDLIDNKISMIASDITISAVAEKILLEISGHDQNVIIVGEREQIEDYELEIVLIEEVSQEHTNIKSRIGMVNKLKTFIVKLVHKTTGREIALGGTVKVLFAIPEDFDLMSVKLYATQGELLEQDYSIEEVNGKLYAVFEANKLGSFAFAEHISKEKDSTLLWILIFFAASVCLVGLSITIIIVQNKRKKHIKK